MMTTHATRFESDSATAIREINEMSNNNCVKVLVTDELLFLDETLFPTRTVVAFRQYRQSKPAKHALLFRSFNSDEMAYTYNSVINARKAVGVPIQFHICETRMQIRKGFTR